MVAQAVRLFKLSCDKPQILCKFSDVSSFRFFSCPVPFREAARLEMVDVPDLAQQFHISSGCPTRAGLQ